jgi:heat shock protein HslJ
MFGQANNPLIGQWIDELKRILEERPQAFGSPFDEPIPVLPDVGATQDLHEKISYIDFTGGSGIGFVGHYAQDVGPFTNENLAYFFQGLTSDGAHYLSFVQPLTTNFLPDNFQEVPQETLDAISADPQAYLQEVTQTIADANNSDFTPNLDALVAMYRSIVISTLATGAQTTGTPSSGTPAAGTPSATPGTGGITRTPTSVAPGLTGFLWAWQELREAGADNIQVTDPLSYTLSLLPDGSLSFRADCNQGSGQYTLGDGRSISITIGAVTKVACPEGSLSEEYLDLLAKAAAYELSGGTLALELKDDGGQMVFAVGQREISITATPQAGAATVTTTESLNILSGPGSQYPSYGQVPAGTVLEVVGKSPDGAWWVVELPPNVMANGQGWVSGRYVETENVEDVPVIQPPPAP